MNQCFGDLEVCSVFLLDGGQWMKLPPRMQYQLGGGPAHKEVNALLLDGLSKGLVRFFTDQTRITMRVLSPWR
ncbi:MAG: hypothetical protein RL536_364 [Candidatus Parcubacteria bacterium]